MIDSPSVIDFLCIGAQKAGTTWLVANLKSHPKVWTPPFIKELHYFDAVHLGYGKKGLLNSYRKRGARMIEKFPDRKEYFDRIVDPGFAFTDEWYRHIFSIAGKRMKKGECSPLYCALDEVGVDHVKKLMPAVKLIYMVRDPFDRTMSSFRMSMDRAETNDGDAMVHVLDNELFIRRGDYRENIPRWESAFDPSQILYIPFGRIKTEPEVVLRNMERHIGLPAYGKYPKLDEPVHQTKKEGKKISDDIVEKIRRMAEPQYTYLAERFGEEFLALIK